MAVRGRCNGAGLLLHLLGTAAWIALAPISLAQAQGDGVHAAKESPKSVIEYVSPDLYPESFDWDAKHKRFLLSSLRQGKLVAVTEHGAVTDFVRDDALRSAGAMLLGVAVDAPRSRVLAVAHARGAVNALVAYDLDSGARTLYANLSDVGAPAVANDVAVDADGNAYVTNSADNSVWKVTLGGSASVLTAAIPQRPVVVEMDIAKVCKANGIAYRDGHLLVGQTNSGALFRVRVDDAHVREVEIQDRVVMPLADGMALRPDGSLVVVSAYTAWLLRSRDQWSTAAVVETVKLNEVDLTSAVAVKDQRIFTLHLHLLEHLEGRSRDLFKIVEIEFVADANDDSPLWLLLIVVIFAVLVLAWKYQLKRFNEGYTRKKVL